MDRLATAFHAHPPPTFNRRLAPHRLPPYEGRSVTTSTTSRQTDGSFDDLDHARRPASIWYRAPPLYHHPQMPPAAYPPTGVPAHRQFDMIGSSYEMPADDVPRAPTIADDAVPPRYPLSPRRPPNDAYKDANRWKWAACALSAASGAAFVPAWLLDCICIVQAPETASMSPRPTTIPVGFHANPYPLFGAMPHTRWYIGAQTSYAVVVQLLVLAGGVSGLVAALLKLGAVRGRQWAADTCGSFQCWTLDDHPNHLGYASWQAWWHFAFAIPALCILAVFLVVWIDTSATASERLKTGASPGASLIAAAAGVLLIFVAGGISAHHALLTSRLPIARQSHEVARSVGKRRGERGPPTGTTLSILPPYQPPSRVYDGHLVVPPSGDLSGLRPSWP